MRGVFIRRYILCDVIPPPPDDAAGSPPEVSLEQSTRQVVEQLTETQGSCPNCHKNFINGLGYVLEGYDALGRIRQEQVLLDDEGKEVKRVPIDTEAEARVQEDDERKAAGPAELMEQILESGKGEACLARSYFRFSYARWDDPDASKDGCSLERLRSRLTNGGTLSDMFYELALTPQFRQRTFLP
jgi:hypothetical protein